MNKIRKYIQKIILLDTIIYALIIVIVHVALNFFDLMFREWVYIASAILLIIGFIIGSIQLLLKIKIKKIRISFLCVFIILLLLSSPALYLVAVLGYTPEHVVEKDEVKYVAYVGGLMTTKVYYYDYKNFIIAGKQQRIVEDYGNGEFDPIEENKYGHEHPVHTVTYYDENGNIISTDEVDSY